MTGNGDERLGFRAKPRWSKWLTDQIGIDVFSNVVAIDGGGFDPGLHAGGQRLCCEPLLSAIPAARGFNAAV